jgi:hypothetical protein
MSQGKKTPEVIRQRVKELLFENEKLIGKELKNLVEKDPSFVKINITERTYQAIKKQELPGVKILKASIPENTWSLGALKNTNEMTPEAVPQILELQKWASMQKESITDRPFPPITVRQAKWVSRILPIYFTIVSHDKTLSAVNLPDVNPSSAKLGWLWRWSKVYSIDERLYELAGKKGAFDTSELDAALLRGDRIDVFGDTYVRFSGDKISGETNKAITAVTSDEDILKQSVQERIIEESAHTLKELPKFKDVMKARRKNEQR